jgi:hypothetical protein
VLTYGRFRTIDLGDLTWNAELDLMCPINRIGTVDLYLTSHHGLEKSGSPALVHALHPRVVVMNNGTRKGGAPGVFRVLQETMGSKTSGNSTGRTTQASRTPLHGSSRTWMNQRRSQRSSRRRRRRPSGADAGAPRLRERAGLVRPPTRRHI